MKFLKCDKNWKEDNDEDDDDDDDHVVNDDELKAKIQLNIKSALMTAFIMENNVELIEKTWQFSQKKKRRRKKKMENKKNNQRSTLWYKILFVYNDIAMEH